MPRPVAVDRLIRQFLDLGARPGGVLLVHASYRRVGPTEGGPAGLIDAISGAIGPGGTLVMPSMSDDDDVPFDPARTPCIGMGVLADTFWRRPGVLRSDSPHAFAAFGPRAAEIAAPHPVDVPHGPDSPVGRVHDLDGQVLLLGVGHDANTTIHLAENLAGARYFRPKHAVIVEGGRTRRVDYMELDHCCERFALLDGWLEEAGLGRRGVVGHGEARLVDARDVVTVALAHLRGDETVFLHEPGRCGECDEARAGLVAGGSARQTT